MTRTVSFYRPMVVRAAAVVMAGALGWGLSGLARPAAAQTVPGHAVLMGQGVQPVQWSERERRRWEREQQRQAQRQPWERYQLDRSQRQRGGYGSDGLWGRGSGELGESRGYRGFNGFKGYGYPQQGTGELGSPPRGRPGGNGA